ncbi:Regulator of protease activity HflC, stomatin/prohibitin superfamily [Pseudomonas asplenii]|uniref:Regulator of protease activity HflC, stomatin/prohibitin superfamily n=1 Tax=Pseudomonas asplenii TaxID=53407 RepID=A0A1H1RZR5_9PSED|nr:protease modulator HflK [Pseudomonas asplenii]SDS41222.1 Regulator of protease activity HflC, stomatin/prohibitin superfamily [Pseudomonas asplenii]
MQVDLEASRAGLQGLPRFQRAGVQVRQLRRLSMGLAGLALSGLVLGFFVGLFAPVSIWPTLLNNNAAALLVLVAALQSAAGVARWREQASAPADVAPGDAAGMAPMEPLGAYERLLVRLEGLWRNALAQIGAATLWLAGWALLALVSVEQTWNLTLAGANMGLSGSVAAALGLLLAFALLVLERQFAQAPAVEWPEAGALARLVRVAIVVQVLSALCLLFSGPQSLWPARLLTLLGLLPALVAAELLLRALLSLFSPRRDSLEPRLVAISFIAGLLRWPPQPLLALQDELHNRFGIDLRQIWAFSYMRRAFAPVLLVVLAVGWLLSGVSEVPLQGRGIYERFGKPVEVFGPGLHVGLPWPLGRVLAVENGVVHELATSVDAAAGAEPEPAEGLPPASANRLWDASHVNEKSQVIASSSGDRQGFQVVNMDVRFVYRIGLSDQAALAATYNSADVPTLIRSTASRVLVHDFASRTLDGLLGEQRTALAEDIGRAVQADLQRLDSGVEILATVVEAIHPPAGAANAYHAVQAAQISAQALISRERGAASEQANQAQLQASVVQDQALASAQEIQAGARAADLRFSAERQAYAQAGRAFVLEQYLAQLSQGLARAKLLVLDHRLGGNSAPTLDLRSFTLPADPMPARKAVQQGVTP